MKVRIDGYCWLDRKALSPIQISNIKSELTIQPRKTTDIGSAEEPEPIFLFHDDLEKNVIGVPRGYYQERKDDQHQEDVCVSYGTPMREFEHKCRTDGPFKEQGAAIDALMKSLEGKKWGGVFLKADPGFGKTITALLLARLKGRKTLILVHKEFLVRQWKKRINTFMPGAEVGIIRQNKCEYKEIGKTGVEPDFVIGLNQSLAGTAGEKYPDEMYDAFGMVISDECFSGNTIVKTLGGDKRIEDVSVNDIVYNAVGVGEVQRTSSRLVHVESLRIVSMSNGVEVVCTEDHPWLTSDGWTKASDMVGKNVLTNSESISIMLRHGPQKNIDMSYLQHSQFCENRKKVLFQKMRRNGKAEGIPSVQTVRTGEGEEWEEQVLFDKLCCEMDERESRRVFEKSFKRYQGVAREKSAHTSGCFCEDDRKKSDASGAYKGEGLELIKGDELLPNGPRRKRKRNDSTTVDIAGRSRETMDPRVCCQNRRKKDKSGKITRSLQVRHSKCGSDGGGGGGREVSFCTESQRCGCKENQIPRGVRVESVKIPKHGDLERLGISIDGDCVRVYNLTVSGHPSYILDGNVVVHNCHRMGAATWAPIIPRFSAAWRVGLTATPRRKDGAADVFWMHISKITYSAKTKMMTPGLRRIFTTTKLKAIQRGPKYRVEVKDLNSAQVINQLVADRFRTRDIVDDTFRAVCAGRKVLVVSERLEHLREMGEDLGRMLSKKTFKIKPHIDYYTGQWFTGEVWDGTNKRHKKGDPKLRTRTEQELDHAERANVIFATKQIVEEGFDVPSLDVLTLTIPMVDVKQIIGRVQRWCLPEEGKCEHFCPWRAGKCKGKKDPVVTDTVDEQVEKLVKKYKKRLTFYRKIGMIK